MTPPERLAPPDVPHPVAHYLDNAVTYLRPIAKEHGLTLQPYDAHEPGQVRWLHGLYGTARDRQFCIQVITDAALAPEFRARVYAWVRLYPRNGANEWAQLLDTPVKGMAELVSQSGESARIMRLVCVWSMPHPTDPDPKA